MSMSMKPYREIEYSLYDTTYAQDVRGYYNYFSLDLKKNFDKFTNFLLDEPQINRFCLLTAIAEFMKSGYNAGQEWPAIWNCFVDKATNCRPNQLIF